MPTLLAGRYELGAPLDPGRRLGRDTVLGRPVVVVHPGRHTDPSPVDPRLAARVSHPNVVRVFDAGEDRGDPYVIVEHVAGPDLATVLASRGPIPVPEVLRIADAVLAGLAALHAVGLVHADLRPAAVQLTADGTPKVGGPLAERGGGLPPDLARIGGLCTELLTGRPGPPDASPLPGAAAAVLMRPWHDATALREALRSATAASVWSPPTRPLAATTALPARPTPPPSSAPPPPPPARPGAARAQHRRRTLPAVALAVVLGGAAAAGVVVLVAAGGGEGAAAPTTAAPLPSGVPAVAVSPSTTPTTTTPPTTAAPATTAPATTAASTPSTAPTAAPWPDELAALVDALAVDPAAGGQRGPQLLARLRDVQQARPARQADEARATRRAVQRWADDGRIDDDLAAAVVAALERLAGGGAGDESDPSGSG